MVLFDVILSQANVLISDTGDALLTDFGFSRIVNSSFNISVPSHDGMKGTINWMAPEMVDPAKVSAEADVWAFGMTTLVRCFLFTYVKLSSRYRNVHMQKPFLLYFFVQGPRYRSYNRTSPRTPK